MSGSKALLLRVTYPFVDIAALAIAPSLSASIIDAHYKQAKHSLYWICVLVKRSTYTLIADNYYQKWGSLDELTEIKPNYSKMLVNRRKIGVCGASAALYYNIGKTGFVLNIVAAVRC